MSTTYSTSLKLTLIGNGDQAGIWGQTTNNNLGTLLEQAITGVQSITMLDANYTLTNFNGVLNEARNAVLVVSGTNSTVRDLIPPVVKKLYTIVNNTSGGFAIRVIGATGTGVLVPNGATCLVYCDGTNFVSGLSGTSGNFTVNGTLLANTLSGNGASITAINASNITSGTVANARTTATDANGASTIVARDVNGSFTANIITANGSAISAINGSNVTTGTVANARTTAASANGTSTIVARDANGSFTANVGTFTTIVGNGATLTDINASNISSGTIANARTTAASANGASTIVLRDTNGSFTANVITANGSALTAINASNISSGTIANARTTAASSNGASTIVARDSSGSFAGNVVTGGSFSTANFTITESGGILQFKYGGTTILSIDSTGNLVSATNITAYGTP